MADLYLQDLPFEIYHSDIADVRRLRMSWLALQPKDGVLCCFKVGWKFALFFDLHPGRILEKSSCDDSMRRVSTALRRVGRKARCSRVARTSSNLL
jgi:hypothetical protein